MAEEGSGVARGERAAFSEATIESGREFGRLCHDNGEFRESTALDGDDFIA